MFGSTSLRLAVVYTAGFALAVAVLGLVTILATRAALTQQFDARIFTESAAVRVDYEGGGLQIRALDEAISAPCGCLSAFMGPLKHGGAPITRGCRMILVLFLYVDGFRYGALLGHAGRNDAPKGPGAGAAGAGYVVYRETVTLMEALEFSEIVQ